MQIIQAIFKCKRPVSLLLVFYAQSIDAVTLKWHKGPVPHGVKNKKINKLIEIDPQKMTTAKKLDWVIDWCSSLSD